MQNGSFPRDKRGRLVALPEAMRSCGNQFVFAEDLELIAQERISTRKHLQPVPLTSDINKRSLMDQVNIHQGIGAERVFN